MRAYLYAPWSLETCESGRLFIELTLEKAFFTVSFTKYLDIGQLRQYIFNDWQGVMLSF